nr:immunoglobulin-like domain-containing protein [uncultured Clostridium sp.]
MKFDTNKKLIKVTDMDMRIMTTNNADEYFVFELYDSRMQLKKGVVIRGNERSEAANALNNVPYEIGDYIYVYHKEAASQKLPISGVLGDQSSIYAQGTSNLERGRTLFKITNTGLEIATNTDPTITIDPTESGYRQTTENNEEVWKKTIQRGDSIDLSKGITVSDTFDQANHIPLLLDHSVFNNMKLGEQTVIYTLTDSWGARVTKKAIITVEPKNELEQVKFKFYSKGTTDELFNMTIDSVNHKIEVNRISNKYEAIKGYSGAAFKIKIIDGVRNIVKREIAIRGNETGFASALDRLDGYSYNEGDRISVWALNSTDMKIEGDTRIESKPEDANYATGVTNRDYMDNVRFEMTKDKLKYIHNDAPKITFSSDTIEIVRGKDLDPKEGVKITDDHDKEITDLSSVIIVGFDKYKLGNQTVTYQYTDSWGRTGTATRTVKVLAKNKLEDNTVKIFKDGTDTPILSISFDDITGKLKVSDATTDTINGINSAALIIKTYRNGVEQRSVPVSGNASGIEIKNAIEKLDINYQYGDMIDFVSTDNTKLNIVRIFGNLAPDSDNNTDKTNNTSSKTGEHDESANVPSDNVNAETNPYKNGFTNSDNMKNTRFQLTENGLKAIYNKAPVLNGLDELRVVKGNQANFNQGVSAMDDIDNDITNRISVDSEGFDNNAVGVYGVTYTVTDSWGRTTSKVRNVKVVSKVENNLISLDDNSNNKLFEIGFDTVKNKLTFKKIIQGSENVGNGENQGTEEGGSDREDTGSGDVSQPEQPSNPDEGEENSSRTRISENPTDKLFEIKVFDNKMNLVGTATLNENVTDYSDFERKLQEIKMYESYYVSVWAKDRTKLKISGEITKTENVTEADYLDGISSEDQMLNVRFENTEEGLKAIYNAAPVISLIPESNNSSRIQNTSESIVNLGEFSHYLGETYKLTENMQVTDDKDGEIDVDKITATYEKVVSSENTNTPETSGNARATLENGQESTEDSGADSETTGNVKKSLPTEVGTYTVTYVVKDSWGREAKASRTLTIQKGLERHELIFGGRNRREEDLPAFKLKLVEENNKPKINFEALIDAQILATAKNNYDYYGVEIFRDTQNTGVRNRIVEVKVGVQDNPSNTSFNMRRLANENLEYGDKIKIYARQTPNFRIKGEILGDVKEDYSDGVQNKMNLDYVQFKITKNGLIAIYNDTDLNDSIKNVITNIDRGGLQPFKIKFNTSDRGSSSNNYIGKIIVEGYSEPIIYEDGTNALKIKLVRQGQDTIERTFIGTESGKKNQNELNDKFASFNNQYVKDGDYIEFWAKAPDRMFLTGNVIDKVNNHDYTKGATQELFQNTRFYFKATGIEAVYNKEPEIIAKDVDVYKGQNNLNLKDGVKVKDDHDKINEDGTLKESNNNPNISIATTTTPEKNVLKYTITQKLGSDTDEVIDTTTLGERTVTYTYTDSWGRTGTTTRKVVVRPQLYKNRIQVYSEENESLSSRSSINEEILGNNPGESIGYNQSSERDDNVSDDLGNSGETEQPGGSDITPEERKPAFEIGFNTLTNKYEVINARDEYLDIENPRKDIFAIQIKGSDGNVKFAKTLQGNDKGTTEKLKELNNVSYVETDVIRVWRASSENEVIPFNSEAETESGNVVVPNLKITGNISKADKIKEDYSNGINNIDFMNNVGFNPKAEGLNAIYNEAPVINGFTEAKEIIEKGKRIDLRNNITVSHDNGYTSNTFTVSTESIDTNQLGIHQITYTATDNWNRTTTKVRTIEVVSKVKSNSIEVYNPNESSTDLLFKIDFDASNKKFLVNKSQDTNTETQEPNDNAEEQESRTGELAPGEENVEEGENPDNQNPEETIPPSDTENTSPSEESNNGKMFRIKVFNNNGEIVVNSTIDSLTTTESSNSLENIKNQLNKLIEYTFNIGDTISIWTSNHEKVKIKGNIENKTHDYSNGLISEMEKVRFKITEDGLQEIKASTPVITFEENENTSVEVKRGEAIEYLNGVTITDTNEHIELSKVKYTSKNIDTKVLGEKEVTYTVTNSWGVTTTKVRKFNVVPKNNIESVILKLKSENNDENYLEIGFDELEKKLKVYNKPTAALYSNDSESVLTLSIYNRNGATLKTLQVQGNVLISDEEIQKINNLEYQEGLFIGVETKYPKNLSIAGNIEKVNNLNNHSLDLSNGIDENELDTFKNTRFKIGSTQIQAIYNEAPVITYPKQNEADKGIITVKKGEIYDYNQDLTVTDDHDGNIEPSNVGVDESAVNYEEVGNYEITYIVTDSWGRDGTLTRPVKIVSNIVGNEIDIYSKGTPNQEPSQNTETNGNTQTISESITDDTTSGGSSGNEGEAEGSDKDDTETSKPTNDNRVFTIGFNEEFNTVDSKTEVKVKLQIKNKKNIAIDSENPEKEAIKIVLYNENGKEKQKLSLKGSITGESSEIMELEKWQLEYGDYISLYASDLDEENNTVTITPPQQSSDENPSERNISIINENSSVEGTEGTDGSSENDSNEIVEGNTPSTPEKKEITTSMIRITGGVLNARELYDSGAVKKDNIVNVRFEITDAGLEALYNDAPNIYISSGEFSKYLGETYKLTEGVNVYDDLDGTLGESSITTTYIRTGDLSVESTNGSTQSGSTSSSTRTSSEGSGNSSDTPNIGNSEENNNTSNGDTTNKLPEDPGLYEITYIATDSWGRQSTATRNITINPGINRHELVFGGRDSSDHDLPAFKLKLTENNDTKKPKISFQAFVNKIIANSNGIPEYYSIKIFRGNVENNTNETVFSGVVDAQDNPKNDNFSIKSIESKVLEYGDKIKIIARQTPNFSIKGEILGDVYTDYSKGVGNRYYLDYVTFEITKKGLVAHYDDSTMAIDENVFTVVDRGGLNPFRIKVIPSSNNNFIGTLNVTTKGEQIIYQEHGETQNVLSIGLYRANGRDNIIESFSSSSAGSGDNKRKFDRFNNQNVYEGDYLQIRFNRPDMMYVMGKYNSKTNVKVDYNEGAKEADNLDNVRFYFTKDTSNKNRTGERNSILLPVYNETPKITGMDFVRVPVGDTFNLLGGVVTSDEIDDDLGKKVKLVIKNDDLKINKTISQNATKTISSNGIRGIFNKSASNVNSTDSTATFDKSNSIDGTINTSDVIDMTAFNYKFDKSGIFNIEYTMTDSWGRTTTEYKTIQVYGSPEIAPKEDVVQNETTGEDGEKIGNVTVELNSMKENIQEYMESYFKSLVSISDVEDDDKDLKVEIEGQVNPKEVGIYPVNYKVTDTHGNITMYKINVNVVKTIKATVTTDIPFQVVTNLLKENGTAENIEDRFVSSKIRIKNNNPNSKMEVYVKGLSKSEGELELVNPSDTNFESLNKFESLRKMALGVYFESKSSEIENDESPQENRSDESLDGSDEESSIDNTKVFTKDSPLWLTIGMSEVKIKTMNQATGSKSETILPSKNDSNDGSGEENGNGENQRESYTNSSEHSEESTPSNGETNNANNQLSNPNYYIKDYGDINSEILEFGLTAKYGNNFAGGKVRGKFKLIFEFR